MAMNLSAKPIILLADDDEDDKIMLMDAFEDYGFTGSIYSVRDGIELLDYLNKKNEFVSDQAPKTWYYSTWSKYANDGWASCPKAYQSWPQVEINSCRHAKYFDGHGRYRMHLFLWREHVHLQTYCLRGLGKNNKTNKWVLV